MEIHSARSFYRAFNRPSLSDNERTRCTRAVEIFSENPFHPSLNYERLGGSSRQNQCSIRASQELRVILAADPDFSNPESVLLLYAGHHDAAYRWASRRGYYTDAEGTVNLGDVARPDEAPANAISSLSDFEEWQLFLHPDQEPLVRAPLCRWGGSYSGCGRHRQDRCRSASGGGTRSAVCRRQGAVHYFQSVTHRASPTIVRANSQYAAERGLSQHRPNRL